MRQEQQAPTFGGEREADPAASQRKSFDPYYDLHAVAQRAEGGEACAPAAPRITA